MNQIDELGHPAYTSRMKFQWPRAPLSMIVVEYAGSSMSGADDRVLGVHGAILSGAPSDPPAVFDTIEAAAEAAKSIPNRRQGSSLGVVPSWS